VLTRAQLQTRILNKGLSNAEIHRALKNPEGARCPKCNRKLQAKITDLSWAGCPCCKVEYAIGADETAYSRYEPNGVPHCKHYG
jgi:ssDNA-binding Zn-finger/Zn-ribbon topoisomerase 1